MGDSCSVDISDEGFKAMQNDPEYERWVLDGASVDIVSSGITVSSGSVAEPAGNNVDVKA